MNVIVNTPALRSSGALSIYLQFISYLANFVDGNKYYIFVDASVFQPKIEGVTYIIDNNHSWKHRVYWDWKGLKKWLLAHNITPDVVVSLQNTGVKVDCRQIIYYHQSLPFYKRNWSLFKHQERILWLYKNVYPLFVRLFLTSKTEVIVQVPYMKRKFVEYFHIEEDRVHVLFPDIEKIDVSKINSFQFDSNFFHLIYPATSSSYKEHKTLCLAMDILRKKNSVLYKKIKIHLTINEKESENLHSLINKLNLKDCFEFEGKVKHEVLLTMYKSAEGLLFPSTIETIGLPLLEAASFGIPIVVSDLDYSREVLENYKGAIFVDCYDYDLWAEKIENICLANKKFASLKQNESSWKYFFELIGKSN